MKNLARKRHQEDVYQTAGVVVREGKGAFCVRADGLEIEARRAVSCVIQPEIGDEVLVSFLGSGRAYVLAVLEREERADGERAPARMTFDGDMDIELRTGRLGVRAARGLSLTAGSDMELVAGELNVSALSSNVVLQKLSYVGSRIRAEVEGIKTIAGSIDSVLDRFTQRVKRSYRKVEEVDQVKAKEMHYVAEDNLFMSGENTVVTAEELVKVDGDQIHLG